MSRSKTRNGAGAAPRRMPTGNINYWKKLFQRENDISQLVNTQDHELRDVDSQSIADIDIESITNQQHNFEALKFSIILRWIRANRTARAVKLDELLESVDFNMVFDQDKDLLAREFEDEPLLSQNVNYLKQYMRVLQRKSGARTENTSSVQRQSSTQRSNNSGNRIASRKSSQGRSTYCETDEDMTRKSTSSEESQSEHDDSESDNRSTDLEQNENCFRGSSSRSPVKSKNRRPKSNEGSSSSYPSPAKRTRTSEGLIDSSPSTCLLYSHQEGKSHFMYSYDWNDKKKENLYKIEFPRKFSCRIIAGDNLYDMGGSEMKYKPEFSDLSPGSTIVEIFGLKDFDRFRKRGPSMLEARKEFSACVVNDTIYVTGGCFKNSALNCCETLKWNAKKPSWRRMTDYINTPRGAHGTVAIKNKIYVAGGMGRTVLKSAEMFNLEESRPYWSNVAEMPTGRGRLSLAAIGNGFYAIGGENAATNPMDNVELYNSELDTWERVSALIEPRVDPGIIVIDNIIYAIGGNDGNAASMEFYDPRVDEWEIKEWDPILHVDGNFNSCMKYIK